MDESWANFFMAEVGATAALSGLVIVAISINLSRILAFPGLPERGAETLIVLVGALVLCSLMLIPQPALFAAIEAGVVALLLWLLPIMLQIRSYRPSDPGHWLYTRVALAQGATLPMLAGAGLLLLGQNAGLYCLAAGVLAAIVGGMINTWVLLVEILR